MRAVFGEMRSVLAKVGTFIEVIRKERFSERWVLELTVGECIGIFMG